MMRTDDTLKCICESVARNCGDMHKAAREVGMSPNALFAWMRDDSTAAGLVQEAQQVGWARLESVALERAVEGVEEGVYYKGARVGVEKKYSDALLGRLLEARVPAFKKGEGAGAVFNGPTQINLMPRAESFEQWLDMKHALEAPRKELPAPVVIDNDLRPLAALEGLLC